MVLILTMIGSESLDIGQPFVDVMGEDLALNAAYCGKQFRFTGRLKNIFDRCKCITLYFESRFK